jgi:uncharacterized UPF0146 family protein
MKMRGHKVIRPLLVCLLVALILELGCFNFSHWESLTFSESKTIGTVTENGIKKIDSRTYEVTDTNKASFELTDVRAKVSNLYLGVESVSDGILNANIEITDAAHALYWSLPPVEIVPSVTGTQYIRLHLSGETSSLRVNINEAAGAQITLSEFGVNYTKPFSFSPLRFMGIFAFAVVLFVFRPTSWIYKKELNWKEPLQKALIVVLVLAQLGLLFGINQLTNPRSYITQSEYEAFDQYSDLTNALLSGFVALKKEVPEFLLELENPYDPTLRNEYLINSDQPDLWNEYTDFAYYEGQFYSYFGVVPSLVLYCPYQLITGSELPTWAAVYIFGALLCAGIALLLYQCIKKLLRAPVSLGLYLLMVAAVCLASGIIYLEFLPYVYSVPIVSALCFMVWGLAFWLLAKREAGLNKVFLILGALCIALCVGCRPQFLISCALAFPLFWDEISKQRLFFSKKGLANTLCMLVPFVVIGIMAMYYNWIRFDSVLDFGANYNLTGNDMTNRGFELARFPLGLYVYFFQPASFDMGFPFLMQASALPDYQGHTSMEPFYGGLFFSSTLSLVSVLAFSKAVPLQKSVRLFSLASVLLGLLIVLLVIQASGLTARYLADFSLFFLMPMALILFDLEGTLKNKNYYRFFQYFVLIGVALLIAINIWQLMVEGRFSDARPGLYYAVKDSLSFLFQ